MTDQIERKAGRRHTSTGAPAVRESHKPRMGVHLFVDDSAIASGFHVWDNTGGVENIGMDNNGPDPTNPKAYPEGMGCCGFAMCDHGGMVITKFKQAVGQFFASHFPSLAAAYFAFGVAQGESGQPPAPANEPDEGVDNATLMAWGYELGLWDGYAEIPLSKVDGYGKEFGCVFTGQVLDDDAEADFEANPRVPWGSRPGDRPDPSEGHDTVVAAGDGAGGGLTGTWGGWQPFVAQYRTRNWSDAWVIFYEGDPRVDWAKMEAQIKLVHGHVRKPKATATDPAPNDAALSILHGLKNDLDGVGHDVDGDLADIIRRTRSGVIDLLTFLDKPQTKQDMDRIAAEIQTVMNALSAILDVIH